jgi:hypothetical protein
MSSVETSIVILMPAFASHGFLGERKVVGMLASSVPQDNVSPRSQHLRRRAALWKIARRPVLMPRT